MPDSICSFGDFQCEGEAEWQREMRAVLLACPDSDQAAVLADGLFSALEGEARTELQGRLESAEASDLRQLGRILRAVCGVAPFLVSHLRRHPSWLLELLNENLA